MDRAAAGGGADNLRDDELFRARPPAPGPALSGALVVHSRIFAIDQPLLKSAVHLPFINVRRSLKHWIAPSRRAGSRIDSVGFEPSLKEPSLKLNSYKTCPVRAQEEKRMRKIVIATLIAAGIGLVGVSAGSAAPANNTALKQAATVNSPMIHVQHWRWGSRWGGHWRWGSRWHGRRRCHGPMSRWWWC
jgi:hypothetical protein